MGRNSLIWNLYLNDQIYVTRRGCQSIAVINRPNDSNKSFEFSLVIDMRASARAPVLRMGYINNGSVA